MIRHRRTHRAKLTVDDVRYLRGWAQRAGIGLSRSAQIRALKTDPSFAMLGDFTIRDVLNNRSWVDGDYDPAAADASLPLPVLTALMIRPIVRKDGRHA